jgi:transposase-like protein
VHYTKAELKIVRDMSLTDQEVATRIGRTKQSIYCKRWAMKKNGFRRRKPSTTVVNSDSIIQQVVEENTNTSIERVVLGNVTIDLVSKTLTIKFS